MMKITQKQAKLIVKIRQHVGKPCLVDQRIASKLLAEKIVSLKSSMYTINEHLLEGIDVDAIANPPKLVRGGLSRAQLTLIQKAKDNNGTLTWLAEKPTVIDPLIAQGIFIRVSGGLVKLNEKHIHHAQQ